MRKLCSPASVVVLICTATAAFAGFSFDGDGGTNFGPSVNCDCLPGMGTIPGAQGKLTAVVEDYDDAGVAGYRTHKLYGVEYAAGTAEQCSRFRNLDDFQRSEHKYKRVTVPGGSIQSPRVRLRSQSTSDLAGAVKRSLAGPWRWACHVEVTEQFYVLTKTGSSGYVLANVTYDDVDPEDPMAGQRNQRAVAEGQDSEWGLQQPAPNPPSPQPPADGGASQDANLLGHALLNTNMTGIKAYIDLQSPRSAVSGTNAQVTASWRVALDLDVVTYIYSGS